MHLIQDKSLLLHHELVTPLTSIQGALKLLKHQHLDSLSQEAQQLLTIANNNTEQLICLTNALGSQPASSMTILSASKVEMFQLEEDLRRAVEQKDFHLLYQPIFCLDTNRTVNFEALARWHHPERGEISPTVFIPLAEKLNLICELGLFLLSEACQQLRQWQLNFRPDSMCGISVNISARQLQRPQFVEQVAEILAENHLSPKYLKLEVTESFMIEDEYIALQSLIQLRQLGVQIYIDDFGTGYSSLSRLQELPFDTLKIDQSFVRNKNWMMSEAILMLAQRLNLDVVVEGVETLEDLINLKKIGLRKMQGYFFSKPVDSSGIEFILTKAFIKEPTANFS